MISLLYISQLKCKKILPLLKSAFTNNFKQNLNSNIEIIDDETASYQNHNFVFEHLF
jgi:hypothetical protein